MLAETVPLSLLISSGEQVHNEKGKDEVYVEFEVAGSVFYPEEASNGNIDQADDVCKERVQL